MDPIPNPDFMLNNFKDWLWHDIIACYWWIAAIIVAIVLVCLAASWADKKKREFQNQIGKGIDQTEDDGDHAPRLPGSL